MKSIRVNLSASKKFCKKHAALPLGIALSVSAPIILPLVAHAEEAPLDAKDTKDKDAQMLNPLQVSGQKTVDGIKAESQSSSNKIDIPLKETPKSVSVITQESIEARQSSDVLSALELAAGVSTGTSSGGGPFAGPSPRVGEQFSLRGQRLNGDRDVRIDGFASGGMRNNFDLAAFESVEVVKGPSSMMYGQGSVGGFINFVQKKPKEEFAGDVKLTVGSYDTYRGDLDITGSMNEAKTVRGRFVLALEEKGSFIDTVDSERQVFAQSLEMDLSDKTKLLLTAMHQQTHSHPSLGVPVVLDFPNGKIEIPDKIGRSYYFGDKNANEKLTQTTEQMISVQLDHELNDQWLASLLLQKSNNSLHGYAEAYAYLIYPGNTTYLNGASTLHETDTWSGELRLTGAFKAFEKEHKVVMGVESNKRAQNSFGDWTYDYSATPFNIYTANFDKNLVNFSYQGEYDWTDSSRNKGAYVQVYMQLSERLKLLGGGRYDEAKQSGIDNLANTEDTDNSYSTTHSVGLVQEITPALNAYVSYGQSFSPVLDKAKSGEILDPETGAGYEVGLKGEWFDGAFSASIARFRQELDNRPIPDPTDNNYSISAGLQRSDGTELEVAGKPTEALTVSAALTLLDAEYIDKKDPLYGLTPQGTTEMQSAVYVSYLMQQGKAQGLELGATWVRVGDRMVISEEYRIAPNQWGAGVNQNLKAEGYDRIDLHAQYPITKKLEMAFQIRNATDKVYHERVNGPYGYGHYFGAPRAYLMNVSYSLD